MKYEEKENEKREIARTAFEECIIKPLVGIIILESRSKYYIKTFIHIHIYIYKRCRPVSVALSSLSEPYTL